MILIKGDGFIMRTYLFLSLFLLIFLTGCESKQEIELEQSPIFYSDRVAMIGVEGNIGLLGPDFIANKVNKYMWHFWGTEEEIEIKPFRVEAINVKTKEKAKALIENAGTPQEGLVWEYDTLGGPNNGADAHRPSNLVLPSSGLWKLNAYLGEKLKGTIIINVKD